MIWVWERGWREESFFIVVRRLREGKFRRVGIGMIKVFGFVRFL